MSGGQRKGGVGGMVVLVYIAVARLPVHMETSEVFRKTTSRSSFSGSLICFSHASCSGHTLNWLPSQLHSFTHAVIRKRRRT